MRRLRTFVALTAILATPACIGGGEPPQLSPVDDQIAQVGTELVVQLIATDDDSDDLSYTFKADDGLDLGERAQISRTPSGAGVFRWTPVAADVGTWYFDFTVSDGGADDTVTAKIEVRSAIGQNSAPIFREPLGTGTTVDLTQKSCAELQIVIDDQDSTSVVLAQEEPMIEGATLTETGGLTGTWKWCPSRTQIDTDDRYTLGLSADDLTNPKTVKNFLVVLRRGQKPDCPGEAPVIEHTPEDESTLAGLTIAATISDDLGLKREPLLYYSTTEPSTPPDLGAMTQVSMLLIDGDMRSGLWAADVPNPVVDQGAGASSPLYYVIVADDDDDPEGSCDHLTQMPASGAYSMTVTNPGGAGGVGICEPCTADVQCGQADDLCVRVGQAADSFCLQGCSGAGECPAGYSCSPDPVESVGGATGRQCVPDSGSCVDTGPSCVDDDYEDNDSRAQAGNNPPLPPGYYGLVSCPATIGDDEDWFRLDITTDSQVVVELSGSTTTDLDLGLYDADGEPVDTSAGLSSEEEVSACVTPGTYYLRVHAWGQASNDYLIDYTATPMSCSQGCTNDAYEDDDDAASARQTSIAPDPYVSETNAICSGDQDWFEVGLFTGETILVELTFEHTAAGEDLDLYFFDPDGINLTPCCKEDNGQSTTSNEQLEYTVSRTGNYYVVVDGYSTSENLYDIWIGVAE